MTGGRRIDDAEFRRLVDEAKAQWNISDVVGRDTDLAKAGNELRGLCVFHKERSPSLRVSDIKGTYHCFGCGASGDIVKYVIERHGLRFMDALRWLGAADLPAADPVARAEAVAEDDAARHRAVAEANRIWEAAVPAAGTPAEVYARSRGITMELPPSIRFTRTYARIDKETGEYGPDLPALIGAVRDGAGGLIGIQRIFLRDGGAAKAKMKKPKLSLGRPKGGALWVNAPSAAAAAEAIITEGPEDGLSLAQEIAGVRVGVALGTAMMPFIDFPPGVTSIVIAGQNDKAGRAAVERAGAALVDRGFAVRSMWPDAAFKDWNDQLRGIRA